MDKIISILKKPARWVVIGGLGTALVFSLLHAIGYMTYGLGAHGVIGALLYMLVITALFGSCIAAMLLRREAVARTLGVLLLGYIIISDLMGLLALGFGDTAVSVINLIALLALMATGAFYLITLVLPNSKAINILRLVSVCGLATYVALHFVALCVSFKDLGNYGNGAWIEVMSILSGFGMLAFLLFGYIYWAIEPEQFAFLTAKRAEAKEEAPAAEEAPAEETVAEEAPAEEPVTEEEPAVEEQKPAEPAAEEKVEEPKEEPTEEEKPAAKPKRKSSKKAAEKKNEAAE